MAGKTVSMLTIAGYRGYTGIKYNSYKLAGKDGKLTTVSYDCQTLKLGSQNIHKHRVNRRQVNRIG